MTMREHLEAVRADHSPDILGDGACATCDETIDWPCATRVHADAMLDALDNGVPVQLSIEGQVHAPMRAIYDPRTP